MCGIVGAVARRNVVPVLLQGLKQLEYRGHDSAGMAVINDSLQRLHGAGRVARLETLATERGFNGQVGIAYTRRATPEAIAEAYAAGELYLLTDRASGLTEDAGQRLICLPYHAGPPAPFLLTVPLQLLAYHCALLRGNDIDKPRNPAKSATVE